MDDKPAAPLLTAEDAQSLFRYTSEDGLLRKKLQALAIEATVVVTKDWYEAHVQSVDELIRRVCVPAVAAPEGCPYCTSDNPGVRNTYFDQTCPGCVTRMTAPAVVLAPPEDEKENKS